MVTSRRRARRRARRVAEFRIMENKAMTYAADFTAKYYDSPPLDHILKYQLINKFQSITNERNDWTSLIFSFVGNHTREQMLGTVRGRVEGIMISKYAAICCYTHHKPDYKELHDAMTDIWKLYYC